jgi:glucosylceramidase
MIWNLVLDETGHSTAGWAQNSPVVIDTKKREVIRTPYFHLYQHFSHFIEPGAHVVATEGAWGDKLAFVNPDGSVVIVVANRSDNDYPVTFNIDGKRTDRVMVPARSFNTFVNTTR